jgi:hypothetical protein
MLGHGMTASAIELISFLLDCFKIFGLPLTIKSDLGAQFIARVMHDFCKALGITQKFGVAHRHESDGTVEIGIRQIWQYLRMAVHDLGKYDAWTPLLCNVQLGCNALTRDVLGGASASTLVFNRKVKPLRFFRPEDGDIHDGRSPTISGFIADNAAQQLALLHRADQTRSARFLDQRDEALARRAEAEEREELAELDWVREGQLVSIPQPEHQSRLRPEKMSFRRRGPFQIVEVSQDRTSVLLRDYRYPQRDTFRWPKELLWPYHEDSMATSPVVVPLEGEAPELPIVCSPECANAILEFRPLRDLVVPNSPRHVRNHEYRVRWSGRPHFDTTWASYSSIWSTTAFAEFLLDANLEGHIPPLAYSMAHRRHAQQLLSGTAAPNRLVPLADVGQIQRLVNYYPTEMPRRFNKRALRISKRQSSQSQDFDAESSDSEEDNGRH